MPLKIYKRKLSTDQKKYVQKCANTMERGFYFKEEYLVNQDFIYVDLRSSITDYKLFKSCLKKMRENYFQKAGYPVFGVYERTLSKPFKFHSHCAVVGEDIDLDFISYHWNKIGEKMGADFSVKNDKPWKHNPYSKFFYNLKYKKGYYMPKAYRESGEFDFNVNLMGRLPWADKPMPKDHFHPQKLDLMMKRLFFYQNKPFKRKDVYSLFYKKFHDSIFRHDYDWKNEEAGCQCLTGFPMPRTSSSKRFAPIDGQLDVVQSCSKAPSGWDSLHHHNYKDRERIS